ncbi:hypothetical protein ACXR6G_17840 [Ancylomarina sp. YFZ004]
MNTIVRNILAVIAGFIVGSAVNMGLVMISGSVIPPPAGADTSTMEGLKEAMHLFEAKHFIFPFLAHACGTFVGAFLATLIAVNHKLKFAMGIACFFLLGGTINVALLPTPLWYAFVDLIGAYLPMAWFAFQLAKSFSKK